MHTGPRCGRIRTLHKRIPDHTIFSPAVADDPIRTRSGVITPSGDRNYVINTLSRPRCDPSGVVENRLSVDTASNWAILVDLLLHVCSTRHLTVGTDSRIRVVAETDTTPFRWERAASSRLVDGSASPISMRTEALLGFRRASHVWLGSLIRDSSPTCRERMNPLVGATYRPTVT